MIQGLLEGTEVKLNTNYFDRKEEWDECADRVVFTGKIDEFYNYCYGKLEYRTVCFEEEILDCCNYQGNAVVNYTDDVTPYTRIIEHKHFEYFGADVESAIKQSYPKNILQNGLKEAKRIIQ